MSAGGFPGQAIQLLAGGVLLGQDLNTLLPGEGTFLTSTVSFTTGALLGQSLEVRLLKLNSSAGNPGFGLEADFDNVHLSADAVTVGEPVTLPTMMLGLIALSAFRQRRNNRRMSVW